MGYSNIETQQHPFLIRYLLDLIKFRHLCWHLVGSDLRSRFRRSRLGIFWAILQPLSFALMIALVWGSVFQATDFLDFAIYVFSGMIVWEYFTSVCTGSMDALANAQGYLRQARIPFFIFQVRTPLTGVVILLAGIVGLVGMMLVAQKIPAIGPQLLLIPLFIPLLLFVITPLGIVLSVIGTQFRDVRYITLIILQAVFFLSPVMLTRNILDDPKLAIIPYLNPMVPLLDLFRAPLLQDSYWDLHSLYVVLIWGAAFWVLALSLSAKSGRRLLYAI